jgi:hypothetical protein
VTTKGALLAELDGAPEPLLAEVAAFVRFLKSQRAAEQLETALLSEPSLGAEWQRPEEDGAWRELFVP